HRRGAARRSLVLGKALEHVDGRVERAARRSVLLFAVPPAIVHLLAEQPVHEPPNVLPEIRTDGDDPAIDARLDLAREERLVVPPMPGHVVTDQREGATGLGAGRVEPHIAEPQERKETGLLRILRVAAPAAIGLLAG